MEVFSREQSKAFLQERLPGITDADADRLAGLLGDLPVALSQTVSTMKAEDYAPLEYMELLEEAPLEEAMDRSDGDDYPHAVWQALRLSHRTALEALGKRDAEQARSAHLQLGMLSIMPEGGVPRDWLYYADGDHSRAARKSLAFLCERGIISKTENNITRAGVVSLHRLQSRVIREEVGRDGELGVIANAVISALVSALNESDLDNPDDEGRNSIIAVIDSLSLLGGLDLDSVSVNVEKLSDLLLLAQRRADEAGLASFAMSLVEIVNRVALKLGSDHPRALSLRNNLAGAYVSAGTLDEAIRLDEQAREDHLRVLGPDHPDTLTTCNNLAYAYQSAGRLGEAIPLFEQTLEGRIRVSGVDHPDTLVSRNNLAGAYEFDGRMDEAITLFEHTLEDCLRVLGSEHPLTKQVAANLEAARRMRDGHQPPPPDAPD